MHCLSSDASFNSCSFYDAIKGLRDSLSLLIIVFNVKERAPFVSMKD